MSGRPHRGTIFLEEAPIVAQQAFAGNQHILRVQAPKAAASAVPGMFAHVQCAPAVPLRRPLSIMRADPEAGTLEFLYKVVGDGLAQLAARRPGETVSVLAPIGRGFELASDRRVLLAIGGGVGIPPMIFLAERMRARTDVEQLVLMGSEVPFPFELTASRREVAGTSAEATHAVRLLEEWGVASRLASNAGLDGCFRGYVPDLARAWLEAQPAARVAVTQVFACGPEPMLRAVAALARQFDVPCQLALEEYMACGVGGCAGCTVRVRTPSGPAMKRVCIDGPVFDARDVYPDA